MTINNRSNICKTNSTKMLKYHIRSITWTIHVFDTLFVMSWILIIMEGMRFFLKVSLWKRVNLKVNFYLIKCDVFFHIVFHNNIVKHPNKYDHERNINCTQIISNKNKYFKFLKYLNSKQSLMLPVLI